MNVISFNITSPLQMEQWGKHLGRTVQSPLCMALIGDLGAGKTYLAKAVALGLGVTEPITSPTFTILNTYTSGRLPFSHFDLYRLEDAEELDMMGFYEYASSGISIVEWADKFIDELPSKTVFIYIENNGETSRMITLKSDTMSERELFKLGEFDESRN